MKHICILLECKNNNNNNNKNNPKHTHTLKKQKQKTQQPTTTTTAKSPVQTTTTTTTKVETTFHLFRNTFVFARHATATQDHWSGPSVCQKGSRATSSLTRILTDDDLSRAAGRCSVKMVVSSLTSLCRRLPWKLYPFFAVVYYHAIVCQVQLSTFSLLYTVMP